MLNTLRKVYSYAKVGVAIILQIYCVNTYLPQVHTPTPVPIVQQHKTGAGGDKSLEADTAAGFLRLKYEMAHLLCKKLEEEKGNDKPWELAGSGWVSKTFL